MTLKKAFLIAAAAALALGAAAAGLVVYYPFEVFTAYRELALRRAGVRRVAAGPLMAWERNSCAPGGPCRCSALVHGLGDSALTWDKMLTDPRAGAAGTLWLAVDMPGTDGSPAPSTPDGYSIPAQARALRAALESRCPEWTVAGNSLGGWTAMRTALDWPGGVKSLVLLDAAGLSDPSGRAEESARTLARPTLETIKVFSARARYSDRPLPARAWASGLKAILDRPTRATVEALRREDLLDAKLSSLAAATTIIWGDSDGIIPEEVGRRLHGLIKGSRFELVRRCGHLPQQECPEVVARALFAAGR